MHVRPHVLLAEFDTDLRFMLARILRDAGYLVTAVEDGFDLLEELVTERRGHPFAAVVADADLPAYSPTLDVLEELRLYDPTVPFLILDWEGFVSRRRAREHKGIVLEDPTAELLLAILEQVVAGRGLVQPLAVSGPPHT